MIAAEMKLWAELNDIEIAKRILAGDGRAAAYLIRLIDDDEVACRGVLKRLYPYTGNGYTIGVTGPPGVGKSTLVDQIIDNLRRQGKRVGVIAIDPTSPFSGGAILGDRIRMQRHSLDPGVFIHSIATRGYAGGISRSTRDIIKVLDAMGNEIILVETVGVGQDEVEIAKVVDTCIVVLAPGIGDDIQAIKAGLFEIGEIFVINKCDQGGAARLKGELSFMLEGRGKEWIPPIYQTEAICGRGIEELIDGISRHRAFQMTAGLYRYRKKERAKEELLSIISTSIVDVLEREGRLDHIVESLVCRQIDPYTVAEEIIKEILPKKGGRPTCP